MRNESDQEQKSNKTGSQKQKEAPQSKKSSSRKGGPNSMNLDHLRGPTEPLPNSKGNYNNSVEELKTFEDEETNRNPTDQSPLQPPPQINTIAEIITEEQSPNNEPALQGNFAKSPSESMMNVSDQVVSNTGDSSPKRGTLQMADTQIMQPRTTKGLDTPLDQQQQASNGKGGGPKNTEGFNRKMSQSQMEQMSVDMLMNEQTVSHVSPRQTLIVGSENTGFGAENNQTLKGAGSVQNQSQKGSGSGTLGEQQVSIQISQEQTTSAHQQQQAGLQIGNNKGGINKRPPQVFIPQIAMQQVEQMKLQQETPSPERKMNYLKQSQVGMKTIQKMALDQRNYVNQVRQIEGLSINAKRSQFSERVAPIKPQQSTSRSPQKTHPEKTAINQKKAGNSVASGQQQTGSNNSPMNGPFRVTVPSGQNLPNSQPEDIALNGTGMSSQHTSPLKKNQQNVTATFPIPTRLNVGPNSPSISQDSTPIPQSQDVYTARLQNSVTKNERQSTVERGYQDGTAGHESSEADQVNIRHFNSYFGGANVSNKNSSTNKDPNSGPNTNQNSVQNSQEDVNFEFAKVPQTSQNQEISHNNFEAQIDSTMPNGGGSIQQIYQNMPPEDSLIKDTSRIYDQFPMNSIRETDFESEFRQGTAQINGVDLLRGSQEGTKLPSLRAQKVAQEHERLVDEVRANHFIQVKEVVGPLLKEKQTSNTIMTSEDQARKRVLVNSYQVRRNQMRSISPRTLRRQAGGNALRDQRPVSQEKRKVRRGSVDQVDEVPAENFSSFIHPPVQPKSQVTVPRDLIMMKIAKRQQELEEKSKFAFQNALQQDSLMNSVVGGGAPNLTLPPITQSGNMTARNMPTSSHQQQSFIGYQSNNDYTDRSQQQGPPFLEKIGSRDTRQSSARKQRNSYQRLTSDYEISTTMDKRRGSAQKNQSQGRISQELSIFLGAPGNGSTAAGKTGGFGGSQTLGGTADQRSGIDQQQMSVGQSLSYHITDLLKKSILDTKETNNMSASLDYYKRSLKEADEMDKNKVIIIKNYRLRLVDANKDITDADRRIMKQNLGTSILVSNSLVKPEIYRYSTNVTGVMTEIYEEMRQMKDKPHPLLSEDHFENFIFKKEEQHEALIFEAYGTKEDSVWGGEQVGKSQFLSRLDTAQQRDAIDKEMQETFQEINTGGVGADQQPQGVVPTGVAAAGGPGAGIPRSMHQSKRAAKKSVMIQNDASQKSLSPLKENFNAEKSEQNNQEHQHHPGQPLSGLDSTIEPSFASQRRSPTKAQNIYSSVQSYVDPGPQSKQTIRQDKFEQDELRAVEKFKRIFEKWVRNTKSEESARMAAIEPTLNKQGIKLQPSIKDLNLKIAVKLGKEQVLKEKPMPNEKLTAITVLDEKPYLHLMLSFVLPEVRTFVHDFMRKTTRYVDKQPNLPSHYQTCIQTVSVNASRRAISFMREQFTHLDTQILQDNNLHPDLFMSPDSVKDLQKRLIDYMDQTEKAAFAANSGEQAQKPDPIKAQIDFAFNSGETRKIPVHVIGYDPERGAFLLQNQELNINTARPRIYIQLDTDSIIDLKRTLQVAVRLRTESMQFMRVARLVQNELIPRYSHIALPENVRQRIHSLAGLDLNKNLERTVMRLTGQIEALYVFSILQSTLSSQRDDPFIKNMLLNFKISMDSPALEIEKQPLKEKKDLPGVEHFKITATRLDLDRNALFLNNKTFINMPANNRAIALKAIGNAKLFQAPFDINYLLFANQKAWGSDKIEEIETKINDYPLTHSDWIKAQTIISERWNELVKSGWSDQLGHSIWQTLSQDFKFTVSRPMNEEDLDPMISKIFTQIKQFQQQIMYKAYLNGLKDYMIFLLGFAYRDEKIRHSNCIKELKTTKLIQLTNDQEEMAQDGDADGLVNDMELIPRHQKPLINLQVRAQKTGVGKTTKKIVTKLVTVPDSEEIEKEMESVCDIMYRALEKILRVEKKVFKLLKLKEDYLQRPELRPLHDSRDKRLIDIRKFVKWLLEECFSGLNDKMKHFIQYIKILKEKEVSGIVLNLKEKSFRMANEGDDQGDRDKDGEAAENAEADAKKKEDDDDSDEDDDDDQAQQQQNQMAFKSVEIDQGLMREEIFAIRAHKWDTMEQIHDEYDFGLLYLDCKPMKKVIVDHCEALLDHLEKYLKNDFLEKMRNVKEEIRMVKGRLDEKAESIDEVISLLLYIDTLKRTDNKVKDIQDFIDGMAKQMDYISSVKIIFEENAFYEFLTIRNWPRSFQKWIQERKEQLQAQKEKLKLEMQRDANAVINKVLIFKSKIKEIKGTGLEDIVVAEQREERKQRIKELFWNLGPENTEKPASAGSMSVTSRKTAGGDKDKEDGKRPVVQTYEIPIGSTFDWLALENGWDKKRFNSGLIHKKYLELEQLKEDYDRLSTETIQIGRREQLLGVPQTERTDFSKFFVLKDELKPLHELWAVASRYNETLPTWLEHSFESLDAGEVENTIDEWIIEIKRLQKTALVASSKTQKYLAQFIFETLTYLKKYMLLIKTLRTRGLSLRHWRQIGQQLGYSIDPSTVTLFKILALGLDQEDKLKLIKNISDIAQKEYAVGQALESVDKEIKAVEFEFEVAPDNETRLCKDVPDIVSRFEEFALRVNVLKTNPHMKNFFDRLHEIEKTVKSVSELLVDWQILQRNWLYLNGIFSKNEISKQLSAEVKQFQNIDRIFKETIKSVAQQPQVYKMSARENFLAQLRKLNTDADLVRSGLAQFLEQKRDFFPRLYFISNEELIDVFGRSDHLIDALIAGLPQNFIQSVFEGVDIVDVIPTSRRICALISKQGERVTLKHEVGTQGSSPENWLKNLESAMIQSMQSQTFYAYEDMDRDIPVVPVNDRDYKKFLQTKLSHERRVRASVLRKWIRQWPSQCTYLAQQIWFKKKMESIFESALDRRDKIERDIKRKRAQLDADEELTENSDEYDSIYFSEEEKINPFADKKKERNEEDNDEEDEDEDADQYGDEDDATDPNRTLRDNKKEEEAIVEFENIHKLTLEEKIFRHRDRYLVNSMHHPGKQIDDIRHTVVQKTFILSQMLKRRLPPHVRTSVITFITVLVYHRDVAMKMKKQRIFKRSDFGWQLSFKFDFLDLEDVIEDVENADPVYDVRKTVVQNYLHLKETKIQLDVLSYTQEYGFEYLGNQQRLVMTPLTEKCQRSLLVALQYSYGGAPEGPFGTGKTETTKDLGRHLARQCYVQNSTGQLEFENMLRFFKGISAAGAWVIFDEFNRLDAKVLNFLSIIIIQIQNSIRKGVQFVNFDDAKVPLVLGCAVFITLNPGYAGRTELPMDLKNLFRSVSMVVPDAVFITEILLYASGFKNASELAKKVISVQNLANVLMQQASVVKFDFGLRSVKAIIAIAENLKQQSQNIWESELPDIINDDAMEIVPYKPNQLISDVVSTMDRFGPAIAELFYKKDEKGEGKEIQEEEQSKTQRKQRFQQSRSMSNVLGSDISESILDENFQDFSDVAESINESLDKESNKSINEEERKLNEIIANQSDASEDEDNFMATKISKFKGAYFRKIFESQGDIFKRQQAIVLRQIGLSPFYRAGESQLEEYMIIKAVKDYNSSKFSSDMLESINGIIIDVFQGSVPEIRLDNYDYSNLKTLVFQGFKALQLDFNKKMETKTYQLYEITMVKQGCIILGETQSGKSTLVRLLMHALNRASDNELKLRVAHEHKVQLREKAVDYFEEQDKRETEEKERIRKAKELAEQRQETYKEVKSKKSKKNDSKSIKETWHKLFKESKLEPYQVDRLKDDLVQRGVMNQVLNPKAVNQADLFGEVNKESYVWTEGIFTKMFRQFSKDSTNKKKWIQLDGPIDHHWVENLNSILDENQKMCLPNGETITLSKGMCLILETENLRNVTPATISRCGLVYMSKEETNLPKQIFNQYLARLPPNLQDTKKDIENQTNWLMVEALKVFNHEKEHGRILIPNIDLHWIVQNYVKLLDTFFSGYWIDYIKANNYQSDDEQMEAFLRKVCMAFQVTRPKDLYDPEGNKLEPMEVLLKFKEFRPAPVISEQGTEQITKIADARLAVNDYINSDTRFENSLKFLPIWTEAFIIMSITWTFGPLLQKSAHKELNKLISDKIALVKSDFGTYQKMKKKQGQDKLKEQELQMKQQSKGDPSAAAKQSEQHLTKGNAPRTLYRSLTRKLTNMGFQEITEDGYTTEFSDRRERPIFISDFPFEDGHTIFDCFFNLDTNQWAVFSLEKMISRMQLGFNEMLPQQRLIQNVVIPTQNSIRQQYLMELCLTTHKPLLVIGDGASGKSQLIKDMLFTQMTMFAQKVFIDHVTCSHYTTAGVLKENIERNLVMRKLEGIDNHDAMGRTLNTVAFETKVDSGVMEPPGVNHKLVIYLEDLHMTMVDRHQDLPAVEVLREFLNQKEWFSVAKRQMRFIDCTNIIACMDSRAEQTERISHRLLRQFVYLGVEGLDSETAIYIFTSLMKIQSTDWPSQSHQYIPKIALAINTLFKTCFDHLKPTPMKVHYTFNYRECFKLVTCFCKVEGNYLSKESNMVKLFFHEAVRQYADRILMRHDLEWFMKTLKTLIWDTFDLKRNEGVVKNEGEEGEDEQIKRNQSKKSLGSMDRPDTSRHPSSKPETSDGKMSAGDSNERVWPIDDEDNLWFSIMNMDVDGYYCELRAPEKSKDDIETVIYNKIEQNLEKYNESSERTKLNLTLYREFCRHLLKIIRAINVHDGHLIMVGLKGFGMGQLTRLACFVSNIQIYRMELHPNFTDEEWKADMRRNIIYSAQEDKALAYVCDEYRMVNSEWYRDLECLVKSNVCSEITRRSDIMQALVQINIQQQRSARMMQGVSKADKAKEEEKKDQQFDVNFLKDQKAAVHDNATLRNQLYYSFLKRVKKNFHLIFNFVPSGANFREKMERHKNLMINSQIIWIQNLQLNDLQEIGQKVFVEYQATELEKQPREVGQLDQEVEYMRAKERATNEKILKAVSLMYLDSLTVAKQYQEDSLHIVYFTPVLFMRTFKTYSRLLSQRKKNVMEIRNRYEEGLTKLQETIKSVKYAHDKLKSKTPELQEKQRKLVEVVVDIEEEFQKLKIQRERLKKDEVQCQENEVEARQLRDDAEEAVQKIEPAIQEAKNDAGRVVKEEMLEMRSLDHPPKTIKLVLKAICIIFGIQPVMKQKKNGEYKASYWRAAISNELLGDPYLPVRLANFDQNSMTEEIMAQVEDILQEANYTYENAHRASKASTGLFRWVKAQRDYFYIFQELQPRKNAEILAKKQLNDAQNALRSKQVEIRDLDQQLEGLKGHQETKQKIIDKLKKEIDDTILRKKRADQLLKSLSAEQQKWVVCTRMLNSKYDTVQGDVLLAAAYITLIGPFTQKYRSKLVIMWQKCLKRADLNCNEIFGFQELFGDNFKIREWHANQLPPDTFSTDNALIMEKTKRYPLIIDPQQLAWAWLKKQYGPSGLITTKMTDPQFKRTLEIGLDLGKMIMVENLPENLDVAIESLVRREITKYGNQKMIKFCRRPLKYDEGFELLLLTNLAIPHYDCNITNHTCTVNFYVTIEGLTQNLLSIVVANERPDLEESFNDNTHSTFENIKLLKETENRIINNLTTNTEKILGSEKLINILKESKNCAETVAEKLKKIHNTNQFLQRSRLEYSPVAVRAANLYFALTDLYKVNNMYQYSLRWFLNVFNQTLEKANTLREKSDAIVIDDEEFKLLNSKFSAEDRIKLLIKSFTQELMRKVIFSSFQEDRQLLTYFMAFKVLKSEDLIVPQLFEFALAGSRKVTLSSEDNEQVRQLRPQVPWMTDLMWAELIYLSSIRPFSLENLNNHIMSNPQYWYELQDRRHITFSDIPSRALIDVQSFIEGQREQISPSKHQQESKVQIPEDQQIDKDVISEKPSEEIRAVESQHQRLDSKEPSETVPGSRHGEPIRVLNDDQEEISQIGAADSKGKKLAGGSGDRNRKEGTKSQANMEKFLLDERSETISKRSSHHQKKDGGSEDQDSVDRITRSRATTNRGGEQKGEDFSGSALAVHDAEKIWTEEELLADDDLWKVTDESDDGSDSDEFAADPKRQTRSKLLNQQNTPNLAREQTSKFKNGNDKSASKTNELDGGRSKNASQLTSLNNKDNSGGNKSPTPISNRENSMNVTGLSKKSAAQKNQKPPNSGPKYDPYERNKDYYDDPKQLEDEQENMARYLIEKAPIGQNMNASDTFADYQRRTKSERKALQLKEYLVKCQSELALTRCIRPDLVLSVLHKIVGSIYDFNYLSFELDVLAKFIDPDGTLAYRRMHSKMANRSQDPKKNSTARYNPPKRKTVENNIQMLINEAYNESTPVSPIFFLVTHSVNVNAELEQFYNKSTGGAANSAIKLTNFQVGRGADHKIEEAIQKAIQVGDWILLENLHLAGDWLNDLELIIAKFEKDICHSRFRLFLSAVQMDNCPHMILKQSVKVALQQPEGMKLKMQRFIEDFSLDKTWQKSPQVGLHKNLYFSLSYLHSVLEGRRIFGALGWNIYSGFDSSDFRISQQQIQSYLEANVLQKESLILMLKYLFAQVNFSGKISRAEDQRKLDAVIEDLMNPYLIFSEKSHAHTDRSHYGIPRKDENLNDWVEANVPRADPSEIYGFNRASERQRLQHLSSQVLSRLFNLNSKRTQYTVGYVDLFEDLQAQSLKIKLAKESLHSQSAFMLENDQMQREEEQRAFEREESMKDGGSSSRNKEGIDDLGLTKQSFAHSQNSLASSEQSYAAGGPQNSTVIDPTAINSFTIDAVIPLFVKIQKLLRKSSLDPYIKDESDRFDEKVDSMYLPKRDENDRKVSEVAKQIKQTLQNLLSERLVQTKLPYNKKRPIHNVYAIEIRSYIALVKVIHKDVSNLLQHIDGKYMKPIEIEKLWHQIQRNSVPKTWQRYAFQTAFVTLADFLVEMVSRIKWWQQLLQVNAQVPADWLPAFYDPDQLLNSMKQFKARNESIPARNLKIAFEVTEIFEPTADNCPQEKDNYYVYGLWLEGANWDIQNQCLTENNTSSVFQRFPVIKATTVFRTEEEMATEGDIVFADNPSLTEKEEKALKEEFDQMAKQVEAEDMAKLMNRDPNSIQNNQAAEEEKKAGETTGKSGIGRQGTLASSKASNYNFKNGQNEGGKSPGAKLPGADQSVSSRRNSNMDTSPGAFKRSQKATAQNLPKKDFVEEQSGEEDDDDNGAELESLGDENVDLGLHRMMRMKRPTSYTYFCPVFRTCLRLRIGEISSDNKPVFYVALPTFEHPRKWVKRSVALLMEPGR